MKIILADVCSILLRSPGQTGTARSTGLPGYETKMHQFLDYVLRAHETHGIDELAPGKLADFLRIR